MALESRSSTRKLISRTSSDSKCENFFPLELNTSMPFLKLPAQSLSSVSNVSAEIRLVVSSSLLLISPKGENGSDLTLAETSSASICARWTPTLLNNQSSRPSIVKRQPSIPAGLFQAIRFTCKCARSSSGESVKVSPLSLQSRTLETDPIMPDRDGKIATVRKLFGEG